MRRTLQVFAAILIPGLSLLISSCLELSCIDETEAFVKAGFYSYSTKSAAIPDSITLYGLNKDSIIYKKVKLTPPALLPLNDSSSVSVFVIKINGIKDTIEFRYWSYPHLISKECGYSMFHTVDTIFHTKHAIDSISRVNENITTENVESIRIFY
ncbi:MAG: hypothetical protein IPN68_10635 [Bacteroidetes bacterium]|nr:hypothetical protein [Bacteroidota bacterium]